MKLKNGGEIHARCFGRFNGTLWDDIFAELGPVTERDVIIVNFGAWYPRFNYHEIRVSHSNIYSAHCCWLLHNYLYESQPHLRSMKTWPKIWEEEDMTRRLPTTDFMCLSDFCMVTCQVACLLLGVLLFADAL